MVTFSHNIFNLDEQIVGWERHKNRDAKRYIFPDKITTLTVVKQPCSSFMLMIVSSEIGHTKLRQTVRDTWGSKAQQNNITVLFLMGISQNKALNVRMICLTRSGFGFSNILFVFSSKFYRRISSIKISSSRTSSIRIIISH